MITLAAVLTTWCSVCSSGVSSLVLTETDSCWLDVTDCNWLYGGTSFTWLSERSGFRHLYLVSRDGTQTVNLTEGLGDADVISVVAVDENSGWVYFIASPSSPLTRYMYRAPLSGENGTVELISPTCSGGTHQYQISPNGAAFAVHAVSSFGVPPCTTVVSLPDHQTVQTLVTNKQLSRKLRGSQ